MCSVQSCAKALCCIKISILATSLKIDALSTHVKSSALSLERVHDVERSDRLPFCMLGVRNGVSDDV